ncbi:endonuclease III [Patescibacteria group bacterium]|nr:endonuclease III [Patescibacteria group bacterium]MBU1034745.1 endonuclease III [Patescibacteria group bacterium]MBU1629697.1 endonuclease III [Patescibacteria group bacterium]MBU1907585.1 endonuclease III [Patescibacteria group bacterium]
MRATPKDEVKVIKILGRLYTQKADMDMGSPEDTLLATLLSARTADAQVLRVFPGFRKKFPSWRSLAKADVSDIAQQISTIGLYKSKAKAIKGLAQMILADYGGRVPSAMEELVTFPGVGRKTASCVLSFAFGKPSIAVDTHVFRIVRRLGWSKGKTPEKVEADLAALLPQKCWSDINRVMVRFGRDICVGKPRCWRCPLVKFCAYKNKNLAESDF